MPILATIEPFVCGGMAACLASTVIHPIDLAKVRLQLFATMNPEGTKKPNPIAMIMKMVREEGVSSVYAGLSASLMRQAVYGTARIGLHRTISDAMTAANEGKPLSFVSKALSGMASGSIAVCIGTPFDVALVRMQADSMKPVEQRRNYSHVFNALGRIFKEEGFGKLYSGLMPNILRGMAMNVGMMSCYDQAKEVVAAALNDPDPNKPMMSTRLGASMIAGFTAAFFSLPFDLIKSRLQDGSKYKGVVDCASQIMKKVRIPPCSFASLSLRLPVSVGRFLRFLDWLWCLLRPLCTSCDDHLDVSGVHHSVLQRDHQIIIRSLFPFQIEYEPFFSSLSQRTESLVSTVWQGVLC
jgi:solute carrier family 25 (mitochondrial oxoglutarate transporter), member 11